MAAIASVARYDTSREIRERAVGGRPWKGQLSFYKSYQETVFLGGNIKVGQKKRKWAMAGSTDGHAGNLQDAGGRATLEMHKK